MQKAQCKLDTLNLLIDDLKKSSSNTERVDLIKEAALDIAELGEYHFFGEKSYGRNLIFSNDDFEVILMCWGSGQKSVAHDHNDSFCIMKCLAGSLHEQRYVKKKTINTDKKIQQSIMPTIIKKMELNETVSIADNEGLHSLMNKSQDSAACTLHFYFPPIHQSKIYDLVDGSQKAVSSIFTSEFGVKL